jgi:four helix bundle protein
MSRDVTRLRVFTMADELLLQVYRATSTLPADERYGLQSQMRRAALSVPVNIVEGSARRTLREYVNFINVATASSAEVAYLLSVAGRLGLLDQTQARALEDGYRELFKSLRAMLRSLRGADEGAPGADR